MKRDPGTKILMQQGVELFRALREAAGECGSVCFTNGKFAAVHPGHAKYLYAAAHYGSVLVVAVNTDESYARLRDKFPKISWPDRAMLVASIEAVDFVIPLVDTTPHNLLRIIRPDFLIKSDSSEMPPVGHEVVESYGGQVIVLPAYGGYSTTDLLK